MVPGSGPLATAQILRALMGARGQLFSHNWSQPGKPKMRAWGGQGAATALSLPLPAQPACSRPKSRTSELIGTGAENDEKGPLTSG